MTTSSQNPNRTDAGSVATQAETEQIVVTPTLLDAARTIVVGPSLNRTKTAGYDIKDGERVLLVEKATDDPAVTAALVQAMSERGASIDVFHVDVPDRPLEYLDEFRGMMHNVAGVERDPAFDAWQGRLRWLEDVAVKQGYSLLLQGEGGPLPVLDGPRYEGIPWYHRATFPAAGFPWPLWDRINETAWKPIWTKGKGATVHLTDPEGTDLRFELKPEHWQASHYERTNSRRRFVEKYYLGHLYGYPTPPYDPMPVVNGVVAGTLNHYGKPFPHCRLHVEDGRITSIEGGGEYGEKWREVAHATRNIQYPEHPGPGLFWLWEVGIGTHPKMVRPPYAFSLGGHAAMFERLSSGYIHMGFGTANGNPSESWAEEQGLPWGHLHIHLQLPTYVLTATDGEEITIIDQGRLAALDDPSVVDLAAELGDPAQLLKKAWTPPIPGVTAPGDYWKDYAPDPAAWLDRYAANPRGE
ncbi:MAG: hypothetical protein JWQ95_115 [Sphaerisporangium sp.]|nr:hypothetical protein [Sphaerisporangium sp.]